MDVLNTSKLLVIHSNQIKPLGGHVDKGAFARVCKAHYKSKIENSCENRIVAYKTNLDKLSSNSESIKTFKKEISLLQWTKHPSIIHLIGVTEGFSGIVLEYCSGSTLFHLIYDCHEHIFLKEIEQISVLLQMAEGINYLHNDCYVDGVKQTVLHRDIKTANILIEKQICSCFEKRESRDDDPEIDLSKIVIKICDLGLSKIEGEKEENVRKCGTSGYKAPEIEKSDIYSKSSDIYSFAIAATEVLFKKKAEFFKLISDKEEYLKKHLLKSPDVIGKFILPGISKDSDNRPDSKEIIDVLKSRLTILKQLPPNNNEYDADLIEMSLSLKKEKKELECKISEFQTTKEDVWKFKYELLQKENELKNKEDEINELKAELDKHKKLHGYLSIMPIEEKNHISKVLR
uniref:Protein kinase domain-containing protein n=1 Tax=Rhabditophanes sp. KR3021 TaxID=114890 RepID=A0AC35UE74_9BILA